MARAGRTPPESFLEPPKLTSGLELFWGAYWDLQTESEARISWSEMRAWADRYELDEETFHVLIYHLRRMDQEHKEYIYRKQKERQLVKGNQVQGKPDSPRKTLRGQHGKSG